MPGVYSFLDKDNHVLYVGKAKNLKNRLRSYTQYDQLSDRIKKLTDTAATLHIEPLGSELEALLIEAELVRAHQPPYNVLLKDDKSFLYVVITKEEFPRVLKKRRPEILRFHQKDTVLGPFASGYKLQEVLKLARRIFPWCNDPQNQKRRACFYYHLELCPGACIGEISAENYQENIRGLLQFLRGHQRELMRNLEAEMKQAAKEEHFERAVLLKQQVTLIKEVTSEHFHLQPDLILPTLTTNEPQEALVQLKRVLRLYLTLPPTVEFKRIECYDVSNNQGTNADVAAVVFIDGFADKSEYRLFNIRTLNTPNDYGMLQEALQRRQNHPEWGVPDLVIIDGGRGQLRAALDIWQWDCPVISIAKNPDRLVLMNPGATGPTKYTLLRLPTTHPALRLVQQLRDEAHRFSKKQHHRLQAKNLLPE